MEQRQAEALPVDRNLIDSWLSSTEEGRRLREDEAEYFAQVAILHQLNPFKRELHARIHEQQGKRRINLITSFEVYLSRSASSGLLDGYATRIEGQGEELKAVVEIFRKDWTHPFVHEAYFNEVAQRDDTGQLFSFWQRSGRYMLRKVALSQGFRLAFPEILAGLPYESAEMPLENNTGTPVEYQPAEHKHYDPKVQSISQPVTTSMLINHSAPAQASASPSPESTLINTIKNLVLENQRKLENSHIEWILGQLLQPKTEKQLEGLVKHVRKAIEENKPAQAASRQQGNVRRFPHNQGQKSTYSSRTTQNQPKASGAEDMIF